MTSSTPTLYRLGDVPSGVLFKFNSLHPYGQRTCHKLPDRVSNIAPEHRSSITRVQILEGGLIGQRVCCGAETLVELVNSHDVGQRLVGGHIVLEKTLAEYVMPGDRIVTPAMLESYDRWLAECLAGNNMHPFNFGVTEVLQRRQLVNDQSGTDEIKLGLLASTDSTEYPLSIAVSADTELWLERTRVIPA